MCATRVCWPRRRRRRCWIRTRCLFRCARKSVRVFVSFVCMLAWRKDWRVFVSESIFCFLMRLQVGVVLVSFCCVAVALGKMDVYLRVSAASFQTLSSVPTHLFFVCPHLPCRSDDLSHAPIPPRPFSSPHRCFATASPICCARSTRRVHCTKRAPAIQ